MKRARETGERDVYPGKRSWSRHKLGVRIEVTTDPTIPRARFAASLEDISAGGLGFWSKRELPTGSLIHIHDHTDDGSVRWLAARVAHCTVGIRGYLVGAMFEEPGPPDDDNSWGSLERNLQQEQDHHQPLTAGEPLEDINARSLRTRPAFMASLASTSSIATAFIVAIFFGLPPVLGLWVLLAAAVAVPVGLLCGWVSAGTDARYVAKLTAAVRGLVIKAPESIELCRAPSTELAGLRRAILDLATTWSRHQQDARTQRHRLEELTRVKNNILAVVSHDLRTPLTSIHMYAEMLTEDLETLTPDKQRSFLHVISDECTRLSRLVDDLLEVQRIESGRIEWNFAQHDLAESVRYCVRVFGPMARQKSLKLTTDCPSSLPATWSDADRMVRVLGNLLSNAIKYTPPHGEVKITAETRGRELLFTVADTGMGIPRSEWDHIFDRFSQLADPNVGEVAGVGLGLYIVRKFVEGHGGVAWVDSRPGEGTMFHVAIPITGSGSERPALPEHNPTARRILVCDEDPEIAARTAMLLRMESFDVSCAHSGQRLRFLLESCEIDAVVTALSLPDIPDAELLTALGHVGHRSFGVVIHSFDKPDEGLPPGMYDAFVQRPATKLELAQAVRVATDGHGENRRTIVLVEDEHFDGPRFRTALSQGGHVHILAPNVNEAARLARQYFADAIIVSRQAISAIKRDAEDTAAELTAATLHGTRVLMLCPSIQREDRTIAKRFGVEAIAYRRGLERTALEEIHEVPEPGLLETVS